MIRTKPFIKYLSLLAIVSCFIIPCKSLASSHQEVLKEYIYKISISKNLVEAESLAKQALLEVEQNQNLAGKAEIYLALGEAYYNQAHPTLPKFYFDKAFEIANELKSPQLLLRAHRDIARVYNKEGQYHLAVEHFIKSLDLARKTNQRDYIFVNYISLAISYNDQNKPNQSLIFSTAAMGDTLLIPKSIKSITISSLYMCIGRSYLLKKEMEAAEEYTSMAIKISKENDIRALKTRGWAYFNLGDIYKSRREYGKALIAYQNALKSFGLTGGKFGFQRIYIAMAEIFYIQGNNADALIWATKAYNLARKINIWLDIKDSAKLIADIYSQGKDFEKAYSYYLEYTKAKDSIENIEGTQRILELQTRYETREKENLIGLQQAKILAKDTSLAKRKVENKILFVVIISITAVLLALLFAYIKTKRKSSKIREQQAIIELTNRRLMEQKADLEQVNEAKNLLFSIISHDLISQVGTTKEFLSFLINKPAGVNSFTEQRTILESLYSTSTSTYALLENLLVWSRNERGLISYVPLRQKIKPVINESIKGFKFQLQKKNIIIELVGSENVTAIFDQNIIATVMRNLIANSIKYSKVGGTITIKIVEAQSEVYISIIDSGVGLSPQLIQAIGEGKGLKSKLGTEDEKGNGLGLSLCYDLIKMHGGQLNIKSIEGHGATFTFSLSTNA